MTEEQKIEEVEKEVEKIITTELEEGGEEAQEEDVENQGEQEPEEEDLYLEEVEENDLDHEFWPVEHDKEDMDETHSYFLLLGRQGVGKSSFVNTLTQRKKASCRNATSVTTKGLRPYKMYKKYAEAPDIGLCDFPGMGTGEYRPHIFLEGLKGELEKRKIAGVIIFEESSNLKLTSEMMFILQALNQFVTQEDKKAFWSNVVFVATKADEAEPNLVQWATVVEKEIGAPVTKENFVSIGRSEEANGNIIFSAQSEDIIQSLWKVAKNISGNELKVAFEPHKVALIVNSVLDYQRLLNSDSEDQKTYWHSKQQAFKIYKCSTMAKHIHAFIMGRVTPEDEVNEEDLFAFLDAKVKTLTMEDHSAEEMKEDLKESLPLDLPDSVLDNLVGEIKAINAKIEEEKQRLNMLSEGMKLKSWVVKALEKDSSEMNDSLPKDEKMKEKMLAEFDAVHNKLVEIFLRWQPGVDDLGLASTVYKTVHRFVLYILGVEFVNSGNESIQTDEQLQEIEKIIAEITRKNPFAKYGSDLLCNLNINQKAAIPLQELRAIYFDEKYGEDEIYNSNCPWCTRPSFNQKCKVKKEKRDRYAYFKEEKEAKREAENEGKKIITLNRCYDCHKHRWNTNHVEAKYIQFEHSFKKAVATSLGEDYFVSVNTQMDKWCLGCFDVYYPEANCLFSKQKAKVWPAFSNIVKSIAKAEEVRLEKEDGEKQSE